MPLPVPPAIPTVAETVAVSTILLLARETGARVHLCRLSSAESVDMVRQAKAQGLSVSCDLSVNHLHLTDVDIGDFDSNCNLIPPLRSRRDLEALRAGLGDGTIDAVCSDHTPVDDDEKQVPFGEAAAGATGLELLVPLTLKWAGEAGVPLLDALARLTSVIDKLLVYPDNMERNMNKFRGLVHSQRVLLALTQKGVSREDSYRLVQRNAMRVWEQGADFMTELKADPEVRAAMTEAEIESNFDIGYHTKHVDTIFARVFGEA